MSPDPVLTLRDIEAWSFPGTALAVLGHPISHSLSPPMHNAALADLAAADGRTTGWRYFRFDVPPEELPRALDLLHERKFRGINLTVPHKVLATAKVSAIEDSARSAGAVNTLLWSHEGWHGFNTDGYGLATAVKETLGRDLAGSHIVLLGAGGAARGAAVECLARGCSALWISNRTRESLDSLLTLLRPLAGKIPVRPLEDPSSVPAGSVVINATSVGLKPDDQPPIELALLARPSGVYDMIYNPPKTALLKVAQALGVPTANGLSMLVHQGAKSLEIWTGVPASRTAPIMLAAIREAGNRSSAP